MKKTYALVCVAGVSIVMQGCSCQTTGPTQPGVNVQVTSQVPPAQQLPAPKIERTRRKRSYTPTTPKQITSEGKVEESKTPETKTKTADELMRQKRQYEIKCPNQFTEEEVVIFAKTYCVEADPKDPAAKNQRNICQKFQNRLDREFQFGASNGAISDVIRHKPWKSNAYHNVLMKNGNPTKKGKQGCDSKKGCKPGHGVVLSGLEPHMWGFPPPLLHCIALNIGTLPASIGNTQQKWISANWIWNNIIGPNSDISDDRLKELVRAAKVKDDKKC